MRIQLSSCQSIRAVLCLVVIFAGPRWTTVHAVEFDEQKLAQIPAKMQTFVDGQQIAGAVTVVGSRDGIVRIDAVGRLNLDGSEPMPCHAMFRIASMTKPITAMGVMILVDEGKLSVDDPVEKYLPEFRGQLLVTARDAAGTPKGTLTLQKPPRVITVRDLLTHTSGLPGGFPPGLLDLYNRRHLTLKEAVLVSSQRALDFEPGSKWAYCNAGIDSLGRIIEVVTGVSYENFLDQRIFQPLEMRHTTFYPTTDQQSQVPPIYDQKDGKLVRAQNVIIGPPDNARHPIPAGGLFSNGEDLGRLYQMTLGGGQLAGNRILSQKSLAEMTRVQTGELVCGFTPGMGFGYGFAVVREPQGVTGMLSPGTYGHGGAFGTQGWIDPHKGVYAILLIQRTGLPNGDASDMRSALQSLTFEAIK